MEAFVKAFLRKFVASLYLAGVNTIPFSGNEFQNGIESMKEELKSSLITEKYDLLSDLFVKTPVQEMYNQIRDLLMSLNGDTISFVGVDNPYWTHASIKMNSYYAHRLLKDKSVCDIDDSVINGAMRCFCNGAGVMMWEPF